jgi:elongation factor G
MPNDQVNVRADVPLSEMFGYSTDIRGSTEGKGEFSMEFDRYEPISRDAAEQMMKRFQENRNADEDEF